MRVTVWSPRGRRTTVATTSVDTVLSVAQRAAAQLGMTPTASMTLATRSSSGRRTLDRLRPCPRSGQYELVDGGGNV